jgi:rubrerythrin
MTELLDDTPVSQEPPAVTGHGLLGTEASARVVDRPPSQFRCSGCGHEASARMAPDRCSACGGSTWEYAEPN